MTPINMSAVSSAQATSDKFARMEAKAQKMLDAANAEAQLNMDVTTGADLLAQYSTGAAPAVNDELEAMKARNYEKAQKLYDYIDGSDLYKCPVAKEDRSIMNVVFVTGDDALDKKFVAESKAAGLVNLGGHRSIGGMRASIYNAMPMEGIDALIEFMKKFEAENK